MGEKQTKPPGKRRRSVSHPIRCSEELMLGETSLDEGRTGGLCFCFFRCEEDMTLAQGKLESSKCFERALPIRP